MGFDYMGLLMTHRYGHGRAGHETDSVTKKKNLKVGCGYLRNMFVEDVCFYILYVYEALNITIGGECAYT